ncbi:MAG: hypothetical protein ACRCYU_20080 [Nocardioides sp.]
MTITLTRLDAVAADHDELVGFMTRQDFPFHVRPRPAVADIEVVVSVVRCSVRPLVWCSAPVAYGILRRDWETGQTTTFAWKDLAD